MSMQQCMWYNLIFVKTPIVIICMNWDYDDFYVLLLIGSFWTFRIKHVLL